MPQRAFRDWARVRGSWNQLLNSSSFTCINGGSGVLFTWQQSEADDGCSEPTDGGWGPIDGGCEPTVQSAFLNKTKSCPLESALNPHSIARRAMGVTNHTGVLQGTDDLRHPMSRKASFGVCGSDRAECTHNAQTCQHLLNRTLLRAARFNLCNCIAWNGWTRRKLLLCTCPWEN